MNPTFFTARRLMWATFRIAPSSRDDWKAAMQGEFDVIKDEPAALSWAAGCCAAALGWRLRAEAPLVMGILAFSLLVNLTYLAWFWMTDLSTAAWVSRASWVLNGLIGVSCAALTLMRPRRAWLIGLTFPLVYDGGRWFAFVCGEIWKAPFSWESNNPPLPTIIVLQWSVALQVLPGLLGVLAALGWVWLMRRRSHQALR